MTINTCSDSQPCPKQQQKSTKVLLRWLFLVELKIKICRMIGKCSMSGINNES